MYRSRADGGRAGLLSIGLAGHIVVHVLTRAFYAMQDTRMPVRWAIVGVAINVPLMAWLAGPMGVEGLALALSISATLEVIGLAWALRRRIDSVDEGRSCAPPFAPGWRPLLPRSHVRRIDRRPGSGSPDLLEGGDAADRRAAASGGGGAIDLLVAVVLRSPEIAVLRSFLPRRRSGEGA